MSRHGWRLGPPFALGALSLLGACSSDAPGGTASAVPSASAPVEAVGSAALTSAASAPTASARPAVIAAAVPQRCGKDESPLAGENDVDGRLDEVLGADWGRPATEARKVEQERTRQAIGADLPTHVKRFRAVVDRAGPGWLASHQLPQFVELVQSLQAAVGATLMIGTRVALQQSLGCAGDPGVDTRLRRQVAELELGSMRLE